MDVNKSTQINQVCERYYIVKGYLDNEDFDEIVDVLGTALYTILNEDVDQERLDYLLKTVENINPNAWREMVNNTLREDRDSKRYKI
jgi:hypothetical protein